MLETGHAIEVRMVEPTHELDQFKPKRPLRDLHRNDAGEV